MSLWVGLGTTFVFAVLVQTMASLDHHLDLDRSHKSSDPCSTTTSEDTCPLPSTLQPPTCLCDCNHRDCDKRQEDLMPCGSVVFFGEQKDLKFSKDDTFYQARCKEQMDCLDSIRCFVTSCLRGQGAEFMTRIMRSSEYEVLQLCHPDADPKYQEEFKDMTECINTLWPASYQCVTHWHKNFSAAVTQDGVDIPRYCCSFNDFADCIYAASDIDCCDHHQRMYFKNAINKYDGQAYRLLCSDDCYTRDSRQCRCLPPVDNRGKLLPSALQVHLAFARALPNSSHH